MYDQAEVAVQEIFEDFDVKLPDLTIFMINTSKWVAGTSSKDQVVPGVVWILLSPILIFLFFKLVRKTGPGRAITAATRPPFAPCCPAANSQAPTSPSAPNGWSPSQKTKAATSPC